MTSFGKTILLLFTLVPPLMPAQSSQQENGGVAVKGQSVNGPSTIKVTVNELHITCIAQDSHSAPIRGLTRGDFAVSIDQQSAPLRAVGNDADAPLDVALLLDVSLSQKGMLGIYGDALHGLIAALDKTRDHIAIYTFGSDVRLYQDWLPPHSIDADSIKVLDQKKGKVLERHPFYTYGGTRLFDAVHYAIENSSRRPGRKAILVLTDGIDEGSFTSSASLIKAADQADVSISALEFRSSVLALLSPSLPFKLIHDSLAASSHVTGGIFMHAQSGQERKQLGAMIEDLKEQYILYLFPPSIAAGPHAVSIHLTSSQQGVVFTHSKIWLPDQASPTP